MDSGTPLPAPRGRRAYLGSYTTAGGPGIVTAAVDPGTGALTRLHATDVVPDPSFLALPARSDVLYAVSETPDGAAAALDLAGGAPALLGEPVRVRGSAPTHLCLVPGRLLTANYGSGSVTAVPVRPDGRLATPVRVLEHRGRGPRTQRQEGPHAHAVQPDPTGRWVLSVDLGTDSVRVCALDGADGTLSVHRTTPLRPGSGPRHLAFHPNGRFAYVVNELEPTLTVCRWDAAAGELLPLGETALLPDGGSGWPSEVVVAPDGRFAWVAVRGPDTVVVLALGAGADGAADADTDGGSGARARLAACVPCGGRWPRHLALDPRGRRLYAANERSGDVTWFDLDPVTGVPHATGSLAVPAASCVVFG